MEVSVEATENLTPILRSLRYVTKKSTGEVFVHLSEDRLERDPMDSALSIFEEMNLTKTTDRNGVLIYLNRKTRKFAIVADEGLHRIVGQKYWDELARNLSEDLRATHYENALSLAIYSVGTTLAKRFPILEK